MEYRSLAKEILKNVGGRENIISLTYCATRLRFNLKKEEEANSAHLKNLRGVLGVITSGGQYHVVVGNSVKNVYREIMEMLNTQEEKPTEKDKKNISGGWIIRGLWSVISPVLPVVLGIVFLKLAEVLLIGYGAIQKGSEIQKILYAVTNSFINILPFLFAYTISKNLELNVIMVMTIVGLITSEEILSLFVEEYNLIYVFAGTIALLLAVIFIGFGKRETRKKSKADVYDKMILCAPVKGKILPLEQTNDALYKDGTMGKGAAIIPETNLIVAPFDARIDSVSPCKNAITLTDAGGLEVLIHIGIDTREADKKLFKIYGEVGEYVRTGEPIAEFDMNGIKVQGYETTVFVTILNEDKKVETEILCEYATEQKPFLKVDINEIS